MFKLHDAQLITAKLMASPDHRAIFEGLAREMQADDPDPEVIAMLRAWIATTIAYLECGLGPEGIIRFTGLLVMQRTMAHGQSLETTLAQTRAEAEALMMQHAANTLASKS